jgi:hypothetical protein
LVCKNSNFFVPEKLRRTPLVVGSTALNLAEIREVPRIYATFGPFRPARRPVFAVRGKLHAVERIFGDDKKRRKTTEGDADSKVDIPF